MAMITCPECGKRISEYAPACIGCGAPMDIIKKLLARSESQAEQQTVIAESKDVSIPEQLPDKKTRKSNDYSHKKNQTVKCIVCGRNYDFADHHCPNCEYPVLSLSANCDINTIAELRTKNRAKNTAAIDLKQPLLTRAYTNSEIRKITLAVSEARRRELVSEYKKIAEQGDAWAQTNFGLLYYNGKGVKRNYPVAAEWFRKAAAQGNADAQTNLGRCYAKGEGVDQDCTKAVKLFSNAAKQGHAYAQYELGLLYENGQGVDMNLTKAAELYRNSADQGVAEAQCELGILYTTGKGVKPDSTAAAEWYKKAAEQGHASASEKLEKSIKRPS